MTPAGSSMGGGAPTPHRHTGIIIVAAVVVILVVILVLVFALRPAASGPTATVTWTGVFVTCSGCTVSTWIGTGTQWVIGSGMYEGTEWGCLNLGCSEPITITGSFSSSSSVTLYLFSPSQYQNYARNGTVSQYAFTTGDVIQGSISTNVLPGDYYLVIQN